MTDLPDKQRFKVGSTGRTLDLDVRDENDVLVDLNSYATAVVYWTPKVPSPPVPVAFTTVNLVAAPTVAPNAIVTFTDAELAVANLGRHYVYVEVDTGSGIVQPPEDSRGLEIEIFR